LTSAPLLLDTHVWFRYQVTPDLLRPTTITAIDEAAEREEVFVSAISIWELALLERDGRLELVGGVGRWTTSALNVPGISLLPLSPAILIESVTLPPPMHKDPADRMLVASARVEGFTLVTADKAILHFCKQTSLPYIKA